MDLLLSNSCATNSNISLSSNQSVAYFNSNGSAFPLGEGIIIRSGIASFTSGSYTGNNLDSQLNSLGDPDLQQISDATGQSATITDTAFLEFDFVPSSTNFSFDFLFASNEYGEFQCGFSDVFAFILTDITTGESRNIAVLPGTNTPISVRDIRDNQYNSGCNSINPELFSTYNVDNPNLSTINMRGFTQVLNASSEVTPNNPYRIKLVIGDYNDASYDSAVFIQAGSFDTYLNLGEDLSLCDGDSLTIDSEYTDTVNFSYQWELDGAEIVGANNPSLEATSAGTYQLTVTNLSTNCSISDQVVVSDLQINAPNDLLECDTGDDITFNLTFNDANALGLDDDIYEVVYYASQENADNDIPIADILIESYPALGGETIYIKVRNTTTDNFCSTTLSFGLVVSSFEINTPDSIVVCESETQVNVSQNETQILDGLNPANYSVEYFETEDQANSGLGAINDPETYPLPADSLDPFAIWVRVEDVSNPVCFDVISQIVVISPSPEVDSLNDVYECTEFTLPALTNGNYFTGPDGTGTALNAGDVIENQRTIYIYNESAVGCTNESSFNIFMADEFTMETEYCGEFVVPSYPNARFYTETGGPNGSGEEIPTGTIFTEDVSIFFYALDGTEECVETGFDIVVHPLPVVDELDNVITCDSYELQPLTNGEYFTGTGGTGIQLNAGEEITSSQTIFIFNRDIVTNCVQQSSFEITIIDTDIYQNPINACGSYTLPNLTLGGYFTLPGGAGESIAQGTVIESSQIVYYFASEVTTSPNCTENLALDITVHPIPEVDTLDDITRCISEIQTNPIVLPTLTNGNYFTLSGGQGMQLNAGDTITSSQRIFIYSETTFCNNESSFDVEIRELPLVDNFTDVNSCDPFTLPQLSNGNYFLQPNGEGNQLNAGDVISVTTPIYIYNEYEDLEGCSNENLFTVNILGIEVDEPEDVDACDMYTLPALNVGNYFELPGGNGNQLNAGDVITTSQTLYIYAENGNRFTCSDEHEFTINIFTTPTLPIYPDLESCDTLTLPDLSLLGAEINYYRQPDGADIINPIDYTITEIGTQRIYVRANSIGNENCVVETSFLITVYPLLDLVIEGGIICVDAETGETRNPFLIQSGLNPAEFRVSWFLNGELLATGPDYLATEAGTYDVTTEKLTPDIGPDCNYNPTQVVIQESKPQFEIEFLTQAFAELSDVRVNTIVQGLGSYEFSLDGGAFQTDNIFYFVSLGDHYITVRDTTGLCSDYVLNFTAVDHPTFFTPNDDGQNDFWTIPDLQNYPEAEVKVYTRHGVLVATFKPAEDVGWNGFNNSGKRMPSSDYWFLVDFVFQGKPVQYRSHFALLRR